jgi:hypothetical protein
MCRAGLSEDQHHHRPNNRRDGQAQSGEIAVRSMCRRMDGHKQGSALAGVLHTKVIVAPNSLGAPGDGTIPATIAGPINRTVIAKNTLTSVAASSPAAVGRRLVHSMAKAWPQAPVDDTMRPLLRKATPMKVRIEYCVP